MQNEKNNLITANNIEDSIKPIEDYSAILRKYGLKFKRNRYYLNVGRINWDQGWIIDISVILVQFQDLLTTILPFLIQENLSFKIVKNLEKAQDILNGDLGNILLGKLVSIYPENEVSALKTAQHLINITSSFKGPRILTDRQLGNIIYTRYGACEPIINLDENGTELNYFYNANGELIKDSCSIPFILPSNINWPFNTITSAKLPKLQTVLQDRYKPIILLKSDVKGDVKKGLWLERFYKIKWCVIKGGKQNMLSDSNGRDTGNRLRWQFELLKDLENYIPIPKAYDLFEENGDTYLVMEYIKGVSLNSNITNIFGSQTWEQLDIKEKLTLLDYAIQIIYIIEKMHNKGYIHRDITPANFLVNKKDQLWMIDLELSYSLNQHKPFPPFRLGTPGFMSPEQKETQLPTKEQDIYAIGAILITLLTGLMPVKFATAVPKVLKEQLLFFIPDNDFINTISNCFDENSKKRPTIQILKEKLNRFRETKNEHVRNLVPKKNNTSFDKEKLKNVISNAIKGLASPMMMSKEKLWVSKTNHDDEHDHYMEESVSVYSGFHQGASGILYLLAQAHKVGFSIDSCMEAYENSVAFIRRDYKQRINEITGGLYFGTAGMASAISEGINNCLITDKESIEDVKTYLQSKNTSGCGIVKGLAGQGLVLLRASSILDHFFLKPILQQKIDLILQQQQQDGSWFTISDKNKKTLTVTGFGHGVAGITCFLLSYIKKYNDSIKVKEAAIKALEWIIFQAKKSGRKKIWYLNNKSKQSSPDFQNGYAGIILTLIKAYDVFGDLKYQLLAEDCLRNYPSFAVNRDITMANGLVGFGEVCLEAAQIFNSEEWQVHANWITQFLLHHYQQQKDGSCHWLTDTTTSSTADFMTGNSGIIHFLLRSYDSELITHPLLA